MFRLSDEVVELAITQDGTHVIAADVIGNMKLYSMEKLCFERADEGSKASGMCVPRPEPRNESRKPRKTGG